jgi:hypothetical protein
MFYSFQNTPITVIDHCPGSGDYQMATNQLFFASRRRIGESTGGGTADFRPTFLSFFSLLKPGLAQAGIANRHHFLG